MAHDAERTHDIVDLSSIYDPTVMRDAYANLGSILGPKAEPGHWDDIYGALAPFYQVTPQGLPVLGLANPQNQVALSLSEIYKTQDASGVLFSFVGPPARGIEEYLIESEKAPTPLKYLAEIRKSEIELLKVLPKTTTLYRMEEVHDKKTGKIVGYNVKPVYKIEGEHPDAFPLKDLVE